LAVFGFLAGLTVIAAFSGTLIPLGIMLIASPLVLASVGAGGAILTVLFNLLTFFAGIYLLTNEKQLKNTETKLATNLNAAFDTLLLEATPNTVVENPVEAVTHSPPILHNIKNPGLPEENNTLPQTTPDSEEFVSQAHNTCQ
jgi:hypothetical protein